MQLSNLLPSRSGGPGPTQGASNTNQEKLGRLYGVWKTQPAHTRSEQHIHRCHTNRESSREKLSPKTIRDTSRLQPALTKKDFLPFGDVECMESQAVVCIGSAVVWVPHRESFRGELRHGWAGTPHRHTVALPAKRPDQKHSSCPLNPAEQEEQKPVQQRYSGAPSRATGK